MKSSKESKNQIDIKEFYTLKIGLLWRGFKQEHISFWCLCIYFLFEYIRPQALYPKLDVLPWGLTFLFLTLLTSFSNKSIKWVSNPVNKLFIVFSLIIVLSGILAFDPPAALERKEVMIGWVIVYFLVINIVNNEQRLILFILAYLIFNLKMAQFGTVTWIQRGFSFADYGLNGAPGWFRNSGEYAIQMLIYGSLALSVVISLREYWGRYQKWILYSLAIMGYLAVMGASSRGSQLGLVMIAIWFLVKQKNGFRGLVIFSVFALILYNILPEEQMDRFNDMGSDNSSLQRYAYWEAGIEMTKEYPFFGVGHRNWIPYMKYKYPEGVGPQRRIQVAHNIFIEAVAELGITGLLCFLFMILYSFVNNARTRRMATELENKLLFNISYGLDAGLIGFLVAGSFVTVLYYPFFWIQISMIVMLNSVTNNQWLNMTNEKKQTSKW